MMTANETIVHGIFGGFNWMELYSALPSEKSTYDDERLVIALLLFAELKKQFPNHSNADLMKVFSLFKSDISIVKAESLRHTLGMAATIRAWYNINSEDKDVCAAFVECTEDAMDYYNKQINLSKIFKSKMDMHEKLIDLGNKISIYTTITSDTLYEYQMLCDLRFSDRFSGYNPDINLDPFEKRRLQNIMCETILSDMINLNDALKTNNIVGAEDGVKAKPVEVMATFDEEAGRQLHVKAFLNNPVCNIEELNEMIFTFDYPIFIET